MALTAPIRQPSLPAPVATPELRSDPAVLTVTVCGSFRRAPEALRRECALLAAAGCDRLSPADLEFVAIDRGFVLADHEQGRLPREIESEHLRAMESADFVWLHSPEGYIGRSAAMELGFAHAVGIPVYAASTPRDPAFHALVRVVAAPAEAAAQVRAHRPPAASRGLRALQDYYRRAADDRGWSRETSGETLERLRGEVEELSLALSESHHLSEDGAVALELADVQLYVVHLANLLGLDLGGAVAVKERINEQRFGRRPAA